RITAFVPHWRRPHRPERFAGEHCRLADRQAAAEARLRGRDERRPRGACTAAPGRGRLVAQQHPASLQRQAILRVSRKLWRNSTVTAINLAQKLSTFGDHWQPRTVGEFNGHDLMVVKVKGEYHWHKHADMDDFFLVLKGKLTIRLRDRNVTL